MRRSECNTGSLLSPTRGAALSLLVLLAACGPGPAPVLEPVGVTDGGATRVDAGPSRPDDAFADTVLLFDAGVGAGFGQDRFPDVVLGPPRGGGDTMGSLDVLSLGRGGTLVLAFTDLHAIDGPGVDFLVFENGFSGFFEYAQVSVSDDGTHWRDFPCAALVDGGSEGCAGVRPVYSNPMNGLSPLDPTVAGGDGFDLSLVGLGEARFIKVTDTGLNRFYGPPGGGFDLDAVSLVNSSR